MTSLNLTQWCECFSHAASIDRTSTICRVGGSIPPVHVSKCPWATDWTPVRMNEKEREANSEGIWTKSAYKRSYLTFNIAFGWNNKKRFSSLLKESHLCVDTSFKENSKICTMSGKLTKKKDICQKDTPHRRSSNHTNNNMMDTRCLEGADKNTSVE